MIARHCTMNDLDAALAVVNKKYAGNIRFYEARPGKSINFRLKVNNSKGPGCARAASGKRSGSGCWHVHGDFFEALLKINPEAVIRSKGLLKIDRSGGNWEDWNIGSNASPLDASQGCDCIFGETLASNYAVRDKIVFGPVANESDLIKIIRAMNAGDIERLLDSWGWRYGELIIANCDPQILPLYINDNDQQQWGGHTFGSIAQKRLGRRKA